MALDGKGQDGHIIGRWKMPWLIYLLCSVGKSDDYILISIPLVQVVCFSLLAQCVLILSC